jgi:hypothetical protein
MGKPVRDHEMALSHLKPKRVRISLSGYMTWKKATLSMMDSEIGNFTTFIVPGNPLGTVSFLFYSTV